MRLAGGADSSFLHDGPADPQRGRPRGDIKVNGCAYCLDIHVSASIKAGEDPRRLGVLDAWRDAELFTSRPGQVAAVDLRTAGSQLHPTAIRSRSPETTRSPSALSRTSSTSSASIRSPQARWQLGLRSAWAAPLFGVSTDHRNAQELLNAGAVQLADAR